MLNYLLYKPNKNCSEIPKVGQNIAFSLGGLFLAVVNMYAQTHIDINFYINLIKNLYAKFHHGL